MKIRCNGRRGLSLLLAVLLPFTISPIFAVAEADRSVVVSFAEPVIQLTVAVGTEFEAIPLPQELEAELEDGTIADIPVIWNDGGLYDKDVKGKYAFTADIGLHIYTQPRPVAVVTVVQESSKIIASFAAPVTEITVAAETELTDIPLPGTLTATLEDGSPAEIPVTWSDDGLYDKQAAEEYTFTADIGEYSYDQPLPTALVTVEVADVFIPFDSGIIPVIDPQLLTGANKVVVIDEQASKQSGFTSLPLAMLNGIGAGTGSYTIVFVQDYPLSGSDYTYLLQHGKNSKELTFTSRYSNGSSEFQRTVTGTGSWTTSANTTLRNIILSGQIIFYGDGHDLVMDTGIVNNGTMTIYGGINAGKYISTNVIIRSGRWADVSPGNSAGTQYGDAKLYVDGSDRTVDITRLLSLKTNTTGDVAVYLKDVSLNATTIDLTNAGTVKLTVEGTNSLNNAELRVKSEIHLLENATLSLTKKLNSVNAIATAPSLILEASSQLTLKDAVGGLQFVKDIEVRGPGTEIQMDAKGVVAVFGRYIGTDQLALNTYGAMNAHGKQFLNFGMAESAVADNYTTTSPSGLGGPLKSSSDIVYSDLVVPEYVYIRSQQLKVGGYGNSTDVWRFTNTTSDMAPTRLLAGQLFAQMPEFNAGKNFHNYHEYSIPADYIAVNVNGKNYILLSRPSDNTPGSMSGPYFRGYRNSPDGNTLSLVFHLGADVGIVYWHTTIAPHSLTMDEDWEFISLSDTEQTVVISHANDIAYVGKDMSQAIFKSGSTVATAFHRVTDPAMFMYVNEKTVDVPAVIGRYAGPAPTLLSEALTGVPYTTGESSAPGYTYDTAMGIQWKYRVAAGGSASSSGGTSFGKPGESLQFREGRVVINNPTWENTPATLSHTVMNLDSKPAIISDYEITGNHPGISITPHYPDSFDALDTTSFDFEVLADNTVPPGIYEYVCKVTVGGTIYQFTDLVTVKRDIYTIATSTVNMDQTPNSDVITVTEKGTTAPVAGDLIYKYYDARISWEMAAGYDIVDILINGSSLSSQSSAAFNTARNSRRLSIPDITSNQNVVFVVREKKDISLTISKAVVGVYADKTRDFSFDIQFHNQAGTALDENTELFYTGGILPGSGSTPPADGKLTLSGGEASFTLQHGQTITIADILADGKVWIAEELAFSYQPSYQDSIDGDSIPGPLTGWLIMNGSDRTIDFTNTQTGPVPTGILTGSTWEPALLAVSTSLILIGGFLLTRRSRRRPKRGK